MLESINLANYTKVDRTVSPSNYFNGKLCSNTTQSSG